MTSVGSRTSPSNLTARWLITLIAVAAMAWLGLKSGHRAGHVPAVWWANAVLLAIALLSPRSYRWPLLLSGFLGNVTAHLLIHDPIRWVILLSLYSTAETAFALFAMQWPTTGDAADALSVQPRGLDLMDRGRLLRFVLFGVLLGPLLAACIAAAILHIWVGVNLFSGLLWFPPSALGAAIVTPLILALARPETYALFTRERIAKTSLWMGLLAITALLLFSHGNFPLLFLVFPPLMLLVIELGTGGGALGCCIVAAIGSVYTAKQHGALMGVDGAALVEQRIFILQILLATAVLSVDVVGLVLGDLKLAADSAEAARGQLSEALTTLEGVAHLDPTTRVANRRRFDEAFQVEWFRAMRDHSHLSLLLLDVDHFKSYNDRYGHIAGDECLRQLAEIARRTLHRPGDLVARFGGEEFAIVLPHTPRHGAVEIAEQIRRSILAASIVHEIAPEGLVTVSIGCATAIPWREGAFMSLLAAADGALYAAKRAGRNAVESSALMIDSGIRTIPPSS